MICYNSAEFNKVNFIYSGKSFPSDKYLLNFFFVILYYLITIFSVNVKFFSHLGFTL